MNTLCFLDFLTNDIDFVKVLLLLFISFFSIYLMSDFDTNRSTLHKICFSIFMLIIVLAIILLLDALFILKI